MLLTRPGSKGRIAEKIYILFPRHSGYVELFFGAGGMFFNKPKAKFNLLNDIDDEIYNLYQVVQTDRDRLKEEIIRTPWSDSIWNYWKENKEADPIKKAARFLFLSNAGYMGKSESLKLSPFQYTKVKLSNEIDDVYKQLVGTNTLFSNRDFRKVLGGISYRDEKEKEQTFVYADPPYLGTETNYDYRWNENDTIDLFNMLIDSGLKFGISEFDSDKILELAETNGLIVTDVAERLNMKNRRVEIFISNYKPQNTLF